MLTYDLKVGYACNNRCKHCVIADSKEKLEREKKGTDLTTQECMNQIDTQVKNGISHIVLTGGEITIRKDFIQLLKKCEQENLGITIQTNGRNLWKTEYLDEFKKINDIKFITALHGSKEETHDKITCVKGSFIETCKGIKMVSEINKLTIIKVVISKLNMSELANIVKLTADLGAKYICFAFPHGQGEARKNFDTLIPTYTNLKPYIEELVKVANEENVFIEFEAIPYCIIPEHLKMVGELNYLRSNTLCTQVKEETFNWNEVRHEIKSKSNKCKKCAFDSICEGVWCEYQEHFGLDELKPIYLPERKKEQLFLALKKYVISKQK